MGLLRLRPKVDSTDSAFQAFARLSLANDSDLLLERLICTLPKSPEQHWSIMDDGQSSIHYLANDILSDAALKADD